MSRRLFTVASVLSLLLCLATVLLWIRSYRWMNDLVYYRDRVQLDFVLRRGSFYVCRLAEVDDAYGDATCSVHQGPINWGWAGLQVQTHWAGFASDTDAYGNSIRVLPLWAVAVPAGLFPVVATLFRLREKRLVGTRRCPACGYDLSGNTSGVCPDGGTPINATGIGE